MAQWFHRVAASAWFQRGAIGLILFNAVVIGFETSPRVTAGHADALRALNVVIQALFVAEIGVRLAAYWPRLNRFFLSGWNVFDFTVVAISLIPAVGTLATVVRIARVLRVARLISWSADLRLIIGTMIRSIPSMGHIILLISMLIYIYAVVGVHLFRALDPDHWGTLGRAAITLFQVLTLEGWADLQRNVLAPAPWSWIYFMTFIVVGTFVVMNLFIAVVLNNLESVREELNRHDGPGGDTPERLVKEIRERLDRLERLAPPKK